jgi:hypothetical protein
MASQEAETYTWGIEIKCCLLQSKIQELGVGLPCNRPSRGARVEENRRELRWAPT